MNTPQPEPSERYTVTTANSGDEITLWDDLMPVACFDITAQGLGELKRVLALANSVPALRERVRRYEEGWKYLLSGAE